MITTETGLRKFGGFVVALFILALLLPADALAAKRSDAARLSRITDETYVLAEGDVEWSYAEPNLTLEKGDLLQTNETGMAEIQFDSSLVLRIGENSRVALIETEDERVVGIERGRAYIRALRDISGDEYLNVSFPSGQLLVTGQTLARIDISEDGRADIRVVRGEIELDPLSESPGTIEAGERVFISPDGMTRYEPLELTKRDDFDRWNEDRDIALSTYRRPVYIEDDIVGSEELEDYGEWVYMNKYKTYGWRPYVVSEWRPYYYGRWYHSRHRGWVWISEEPWGYATHHYGSWNYDPYYGWIWIPGTYWRPAHVHWVTYDDYVGWVPVGYYGRPVVTIYPYYVTGLYIDYFDSFSFTFVFRSHFHAYRHHHYRHFRHRRDHAYDRDWRDKKFPPDARRRVDVIDHRTNPGRIVKGRVQFLKDIEKMDLKKDMHKGRLVRDRLDYGKVLDVENHPKMERKLTRLDQMDRRPERRGIAPGVNELPKKRTDDEMKRFDFRERVKKHEKVPLQKNVRIIPAPERKKQHGIEVDTHAKDRKPVNLKRLERQAPSRPAVEREEMKQEPAVDKPLSKKRDRWDISDIRQRDKESLRKHKRVEDRPFRPEQKDRPMSEAILRDHDNVRRADSERRVGRPVPPAEQVRSERPRPSQEKIVRELPRQEMPERRAVEVGERLPRDADREVFRSRDSRVRNRDNNSRAQKNSPRSFGKNR